MPYPPVRNFIGGEFVDSVGERTDVISPLDGSRLSTVPLSIARDVDSAVDAAQQVFAEWSERTIKERAQVAYRYRELLLRNQDQLAELIHVENGKTFVLLSQEIYERVKHVIEYDDGDWTDEEMTHLAAETFEDADQAGPIP